MPRSFVVVVLHSHGTGMGWLSEYLTRRWDNLLIVKSFQDQLPDPDLLNYPVVVMGGPMGVPDIPSLPWLAREADWISQLLARDHPMLGICLGAQLMAHSLGHTVRSCQEGTMECGYYPTQSSALPSHVYHWHQDGIYLTDEGCAKLNCLGRSDWKRGSTTQGFVRGRTLGVQFHPEVDEHIISSWLKKDPEHMLRPMARAAQTHLPDHQRFGAGQRQWLTQQLDRLWP